MHYKWRTWEEEKGNCICCYEERKEDYVTPQRNLQGKLTIETLRWNRKEKSRSWWWRNVVELVRLLWPIPLPWQDCSANISATFCAGSLRCQQIYYLLTKWPHFLFFIQENLTAQAEIQVEWFRENPTSSMYALVNSMVLNLIKLHFGTK